jgi:hypothetical protein
MPRTRTTSDTPSILHDPDSFSANTDPTLHAISLNHLKRK